MTSKEALLTRTGTDATFCDKTVVLWYHFRKEWRHSASFCEGLQKSEKLMQNVLDKGRGRGYNSYLI
jgi:hypothetical protein